MSRSHECRRLAFAGTLLAASILVSNFAMGAPAKVPVVGKYRMYQGDFTVGKDYDNPYDPKEVAVDATFRGPQGNTLIIPCFYGSGTWHVRFSSPIEGGWSWTASIKDSKGTRKLEPRQLRVESPKKATGAMGYIGVEAGTPYFNTSEGGTYIPIGGNVAWGNPEEYDGWFRGMAQNGANFARVWSSYQGGFGLEGPLSGGYPGLGRYNEGNAVSLDHVVSLGESLGIRILLAMGNYRELIDKDSWGDAGWPTNPYNAVNGGPVVNASDMWTDGKARDLYKNRLRYIVARWGYSPSIFAWEFWNETDAPEAWIREMSGYLKSIDPYGHPVSTTYGTPGIWSLPDIDFTMTHMYAAGDSEDMSGAFKGDAVSSRTFGKPHLLAEFGLDWRKPDGEYDPEGKADNFRHGLWAPFLSGNAGAGAIWWWDNYISPQDLYGVYAPFARFVRGVPWRKTEGPLDLTLQTHGGGSYDLRINPEPVWGKYADKELVVSRTAPGGGITGVPGFLYGSGKAPWNKPIDLKVDNQAPTSLTLGVAGVSADCRLVVSVDGKTAWSKDFKPRDGQGEWESSEYKAEWKTYQAVYNKEYEVPIPAGEHRISIRITSGDWMSLNKMLLKGYSSSPNLLATGIKGKGFAAFWLHDPKDTWKNSLDKKPLQPIKGMTAVLQGMDDGAYSVEWWDTRSGKVVNTGVYEAKEGKVVIDIPDFLGEVACKIMEE